VKGHANVHGRPVLPSRDGGALDIDDPGEVRRDDEGESINQVSVAGGTVERVVRRTSSEDGQVLVEYSLVLGLIVLGAVALLSAVGGKVGAMLSLISGAF
jgi:Flp pilus assembly pilin Flp